METSAINSPVADVPPLLKIGESATVARCSTKTVRRAIERGLLRAFRPRGSTRLLIRRADLLAWLGIEVGA